MAHKKRRIQIIIVLLIFIIYFLLAARPVPNEIVLAPRWISSLSPNSNDDNVVTEYAVFRSDNFEFPAAPQAHIPFTLGARFGFVDPSGQFSMNRYRSNDIYLSRNMWTEYEAQPSRIIINNIIDNSEITIENTRGYPILLDDSIFILGSEQNSLSKIDRAANILWTYELGAPITCIDAAAGFVVTGSLDGVIVVFNSDGERIFYFEPTGSRYSVILGCAISRDGSRIAVISGIDEQRFLLLERLIGSADEFRIIYHEFLETGFRRPVRVFFIDEDRRIVFERAGGINIYNIRTRRAMFIPLDGEIAAIDEAGDQGYFFIITSPEGGALMEKKLIGIRFPLDRLLDRFISPAGNGVFMSASFKSSDVFLGRTGRTILVGGGSALISFDMEEK